MNRLPTRLTILMIVLRFLSNTRYPGDNFTIKKYNGLIYCCVSKLFRHCITSFPVWHLLFFPTNAIIGYFINHTLILVECQLKFYFFTNDFL